MMGQNPEETMPELHTLPIPRAPRWAPGRTLLGCVLLALALLGLSGCPDAPKPKPAAEEPREAPPPRPRVDEAFLRRALGPEASLSGEALVGELAPAPGEEALLTARDGGRFVIAMVRGNHKVLARAPVGGRVMATGNVRAVGKLRAIDFPGVTGKVFVLPVETMVQRQFVCGLILLRYRGESLATVGELGSRCWRKAAGAAAETDPHTLYKLVEAEGQTVLEVEEERVIRPYRWDAVQYAFVSMTPRKR